MQKFLLLLFFPLQLVAQTIDPSRITIVRDSLGVPHIFAPSDAEVAYGLAWANCEDAFHETQNLLYTAKGMMARKEGVNGAKADFFMHAIGARKIVDERYDKDLTPAFKKYINGFVQGVNAYVAAHPDDVVLKKAFPITDKDVLTAYVIVMSYLSWVQNQVTDAISGKYDGMVVDYTVKTPSVGSNAYACSPAKTADGKTYLCINPHVSMNGALSFYEAHLQSEEGLAMVGNMFQFGTSHAMGTNRHLGWGFTWNYFDRVDVYRLQMHPHKKLLYEFDGQWLKLEKRPVWLKVNLAKKGKFILPIKKMSYWSKYGCTLKSTKSKNFYAIRYPANMTIKAGQQLYEMARAENYAQFWDALRNNHAIALFNLVYADDKANVFYLSHGEMPNRKNQQYNWKGILPGNTSQTLWTDLVPIDSMPHVINPRCGYVYNCNNNVYHATCEGENDNPNRLPAYVNERPYDNNRSQTLHDFFEENERVTFDAFKQIKFTTRFPKHSTFLSSFDPLWNYKASPADSVSDLLEIIQSWDRNTDTSSIGTTAFGVFLQSFWKERHYDDTEFGSGFSITNEEVLKHLRIAKKYLLTHFGTLRIPWGSVHHLRRGNKSLPMPSFVDMLSPSYPREEIHNGKIEYVPHHGDTYTMFVKFGKDTIESIESLMPLGNSIRPDSPHYNDQMENFLAQKTHIHNFDKAYWVQHAERVYSPVKQKLP